MPVTRRSLLAAALAPASPRHLTVYREAGRFGGWPANHGIWEWNDEILCGFSAAYFKRMPLDRHQYDSAKPEEPRLARSKDGGETWTIEAPPSLLPPEQGGTASKTLAEAMDFTARGFAMTLRFHDNHVGPSRLWHTADKGHTWQGPFDVPAFGTPGVAARTDYVVLGKRDALIFLTAAKQNRREGRVLCARTQDGGVTWKLQGFVGPEPAGFSIMPSTVQLKNGTLLTAVRVKQDQRTDWIELWESGDLGVTWKQRAKPVGFTGGMSGNPPSLLRLTDGRLALTYGHRGEPFGIRAVLSENEGRAWTEPVTLRNDGAAWDLGYTRSVQRRDGQIVTLYYFPEKPQTERIIAATIWRA